MPKISGPTHLSKDPVKKKLMPYRCRGKTVQVFRNGKWASFRQAKSVANCKAQATALNIALARETGKKVVARR